MLLGPDHISDEDVPEEGPVPFTLTQWQYTWGHQHGLDTLCTKVVDLYRGAFRNPISTSDKKWTILVELKENGLENSGLSKVLIEGKAWQMRFFGHALLPGVPHERSGTDVQGHDGTFRRGYEEMSWRRLEALILARVW